MKFLLAFVVALHAQVCFAATPRLFTERAVSPERIAEAVNHFVELGEEAADAELRHLHATLKPDPTGWIDANERLLWVCRVLYDPKAGELIPMPALGAPPWPFRELPDGHWPQHPIARSGSSYFVLCGHELDGVPEQLPGYLDGCRRRGTFRMKNVPVPTRDQTLEDAASLRRSQAWREMNWPQTPAGAPDDEWLRRFIEEQASAIELSGERRGAA